MTFARRDLRLLRRFFRVGTGIREGCPLEFAALVKTRDKTSWREGKVVGLKIGKGDNWICGGCCSDVVVGELGEDCICLTAVLLKLPELLLIWMIDWRHSLNNCSIRWTHSGEHIFCNERLMWLFGTNRVVWKTWRDLLFWKTCEVFRLWRSWKTSISDVRQMKDYGVTCGQWGFPLTHMVTWKTWVWIGRLVCHTVLTSLRLWQRLSGCTTCLFYANYTIQPVWWMEAFLYLVKRKGWLNQITESYSKVLKIIIRKHVVFLSSCSSRNNKNRLVVSLFCTVKHSKEGRRESVER